MRLTAIHQTDIGLVRRENQDSVLMDLESIMFFLADGMGGHQAGKLASMTAIQAAHSALKKQKRVDPQKRVENALRVAHLTVLKKSRIVPDSEGMGTTLDIGIIEGNQFFWGHVGDSRIYRSREGKTSQVTEDETVAARMVKSGVLDPDEAVFSEWNSMLTNTIGVNPGLVVNSGVFFLQPRDRILFTSDGLHDLVPREDLSEILTIFPLPDVLPFLIHEAKLNGGTDNISGLVIEVGDD